MPLDGHSYLVSQGWEGKGTGLRQGAISRPLAIPQKKNLAGLGKDRDEAFPFWDHLFSAAAKSIQLTFASDDDESDTDALVPEMKRTVTGILSNRRPVTGISASTSGTTTPESGGEGPRASLLTLAKREAARSCLYAKFFRGPILGPDDDHSTLKAQSSKFVTESTVKVKDEKRTKCRTDGSEFEAPGKKRKRDGEDDPQRRKCKRERKEKRKAGEMLEANERVKRLRKKEKKERDSNKDGKAKTQRRKVRGMSVQLNSSNSEIKEEKGWERDLKEMEKSARNADEPNQKKRKREKDR